MRTPPTVELTMDDLETLLKRAKSSLGKEDYEKLELLHNAYFTLTDLIEDERMTIRKLREMLYGRSTEKTSEVLGRAEQGAPSSADKPKNKSKRKAKGHGRNGAKAYTRAERIEIPHEQLKHKDRCPECKKGKVYRKKPQVLVRITGEPPLRAMMYQLERLRCNLCGEIFTASPPDGVGDDKYDATSAAMIGLLRYGSGLPFNRLEGLQGAMGIPLPASTQWDVARDASVWLEPVFEELIRQAADGDVVHNDDTSMRVLSLKNEPPEDGMAADRTGVFTSGIVSTVKGRKVALFFTGRKHAGENLNDVLKRRASELPAPIQMCDALSRNLPKELEVILANCNAHGRRYFVNVVDNFPEECRHVLEALAEVYRVDASARKQKLSPDERLHLHQAESQPILEELHRWFETQFAKKNVEPNSGLGQAISYMLKHWEKLTRFLHVPGVPIDNNICERALKKAILHRKNSLFYKTKNGAHVGDTFLSLIHTAELNDVDPFGYLTELLRHRDVIHETPRDWLPWSYSNTLRDRSQRQRTI